MNFTALDHREQLHTVPHQEGWTLLLFNPVFGRYGCKSCQTSLAHELYPDLRAADCRVYGVTYDDPQANALRVVGHVWTIPILTIGKDEAVAWDVVRDENDAWYAYTPKTKSFLFRDGELVKEFLVPDPAHHARDVLDIVTSTKG